MHFFISVRVKAVNLELMEIKLLFIKKDLCFRRNESSSLKIKNEPLP